MEKVLLAVRDFSTSRIFASFLSDSFIVECQNNQVDAINAIQNNSYSCILIDFSDSSFEGSTVFDFLANSHQLSSQPVSVIIDPPNLQLELDLFNKGCAEIFHKPLDSLITRKRIQNIITIYTLRKNVAVFEQKLLTDPLTGLLNKDGFQTKVRKRIKIRKMGAFLMCDMDGLKFINDNYSHSVGDEIIKGFAKTLEECLPPRSYIAHVSGDEFCAFVRGIESKEQVEEICANVLKTLVSKVLLPDLARPVTASIGIAMFPEAATTFENLHSKADHALLYVKNHGKNGYKFHAPRDDREELLKGRQECTNVPVELMLKKREDEDIQTWLKFGEFRIVYIAYEKYSKATLEAHLCHLQIRDLKNPDNPDSKKVMSLNEKITTFIKEAQYPGIFSWYSINQLLILAIKKETLPQGIDHLKQELSEEMTALQLDIDFSVK